MLKLFRAWAPAVYSKVKQAYGNDIDYCYGSLLEQLMVFIGSLFKSQGNANYWECNGISKYWSKFHKTPLYLLKLKSCSEHAGHHKNRWYVRTYGEQFSRMEEHMQSQSIHLYRLLRYIHLFLVVVRSTASGRYSPHSVLEPRFKYMALFQNNESKHFSSKISLTYLEHENKTCCIVVPSNSESVIYHEHLGG